MIPIWTPNARQNLSGELIGLGSTVADYQPGNFTGTTNASAWLNSIGAAPSLTQATGSAQPTINADGSLTFDGVAQFMSMTTTLVQPEVVILVGSQVTWTSLDYIFDGATNATGALVQYPSPSPTVEILAPSGTASNTGLVLNTKSIVVATFNGASSSLQVNDNTATTGNAGASNMGGFTLGANGGNTAFGNITADEVILLNSVPSAATLDRIIALLNAIHGAY